MITLEVLSDIPPMDGTEFKEKYGAYSIALDGFVLEAPWFDPSLPAQNFNHHQGVSRLETRATCMQVAMALRAGLYQTFCNKTGPLAKIYVNDCDEDICLSWWLLTNPDISIPINHPCSQRLNKLLYITDMLDTTAGAFPFEKDSIFLEEIAWIYEPYRNFRSTGGLIKRDNKEFAKIISLVGQRITDYVFNRGSCLPLDTRFHIIAKYKTWTHVYEIGSQARLGVFGNGITAFVSSSPYGEGRWMHILGRSSEYIPFPVEDLINLLNKEEAGTAYWGGGPTIGGAPRINGSRLTPNEVANIINNFLESANK